MQAPKSEINLKENRVAICLKAKIYSLEAIQSAVYVFIDRAYVYLDGNSRKEFVVILKGKKKLSKDQLENLRGEFLNEIMNASLRGNIFQKNKKIIEYIVGGAITAALGNKSKVKEGKNTETRKIEKEIAELKKELEKDFDS